MQAVKYFLSNNLKTFIIHCHINLLKQYRFHCFFETFEQRADLCSNLPLHRDTFTFLAVKLPLHLRVLIVDAVKETSTANINIKQNCNISVG